MRIATRFVRRQRLLRRTIVCAALLAPASVWFPNSVAARAESCQFVVPPGNWLATGIYLHRGDVARIRATGTMRYADPPNIEFGPGGDSYGIWSLAAKVGSGIEDIGFEGKIVAGEDGQLELGAPAKPTTPVEDGRQYLDSGRSYCVTVSAPNSALPPPGTPIAPPATGALPPASTVSSAPPATPIPQSGGGSEGCQFVVRPGSWLTTGISLRRGESVQVRATGTMRYREPPNTEFGPGGDAYGVWSLAARVGTDVSQVGAGAEVVAWRDGRLELGAPARANTPVEEGARQLDGNRFFCVTVSSAAGSAGGTFASPPPSAPPAPAPAQSTVHIDVQSAPPGAFDLTGSWRDENGTLYLVRQDGRDVCWSMNGLPRVQNVFCGSVVGSYVVGRWLDLPGSELVGGGRLVLQIESRDRLRKVHQAGDYGASVWTRQ